MDLGDVYSLVEIRLFWDATAYATDYIVEGLQVPFQDSPCTFCGVLVRPVAALEQVHSFPRLRLEFLGEMSRDFIQRDADQPQPGQEFIPCLLQSPEVQRLRLLLVQEFNIRRILARFFVQKKRGQYDIFIYNF